MRTANTHGPPRRGLLAKIQGQPIDIDDQRGNLATLRHATYRLTLSTSEDVVRMTAGCASRSTARSNSSLGPAQRGKAEPR